MLIRLSQGGSAVSVSYGSIPPDYIERLFSPTSLLDILIRTALGFGVLWCGLSMVKRDKFLWRSALIYVPLVLLAALVLSSRITRVIGILYPVIVPGFLYLLDKP